jgi:hypothetical protein
MSTQHNTSSTNVGKMGAHAVECRAEGITNGSVCHTPALLLKETFMKKELLIVFLDAHGIFLPSVLGPWDNSE